MSCCNYRIGKSKLLNKKILNGDKMEEFGPSSISLVETIYQAQLQQLLSPYYSKFMEEILSCPLTEPGPVLKHNDLQVK